jgi:hypothetical protein
MNLSSKLAATAIAATVSFTGVASAATAFGATSHSHQYMTQSKTSMKMDTVKVHVMKVYPVSATEIKLDADKMALANKTIMVRPMHKMGMAMSMTAKYDVMKGTFVLSGGNKLTPGITYDVSASWAQIPKMDASFAIPNLVKVMQISKNKVELVYDRAVDTMSATTPGNYWIRSDQAMASGIANLGKNDMVTATNGLKKSQVMITAVDKSKKKFIMTFTANVTPGVKYTVIPCSVDANGSMGYMGPNFSTMSMNTFVGSDF